MNEEDFRLYWMGKKPSMRDAVMEYIALDGKKTLDDIADKHEVSLGGMRPHIRKLRKLGVKIHKSSNDPRAIFCLICEKNMINIYPRYKIAFQESKFHRPTSFGNIHCGCLTSLLQSSTQRTKKELET